MNTLPIAALTICLGAAALCRPANASIVIVNFSGTIDTISDPNHHLTSPIDIGDPFTAQLVYDTTAPGSSIGSETLYNNGSSTFSFDVTIDGVAFQSSADPFGQFPIQDSFYQWDELRPSLPASVNFPGDDGTNLIELDLGGGSHSQALPSSLNLSDYSYKYMQIQYNSFSSPDNLTIGGPVTSLTTSSSSVPEPGSILLFPLGIALLAGGRWRYAGNWKSQSH